MKDNLILGKLRLIYNDIEYLGCNYYKTVDKIVYNTNKGLLEYKLDYRDKAEFYIYQYNSEQNGYLIITSYVNKDKSIVKYIKSKGVLDVYPFKYNLQHGPDFYPIEGNKAVVVDDEIPGILDVRCNFTFLEMDSLFREIIENLQYKRKITGYKQEFGTHTYVGLSRKEVKNILRLAFKFGTETRIRAIKNIIDISAREEEIETVFEITFIVEYKDDGSYAKFNLGIFEGKELLQLVDNRKQGSQP